MCEHKFIKTTYSKICEICGTESFILNLDTYNIFSAPISKSYDRKQRFKIKIDKLFLLHNGPNIKDDIWKALENNHFSTPQSIRDFLRHAKLKNKHYDCLRLFSKLFAKYEIQVEDSTALRNQILSDFDEIFFKWNSIIQSGLFFSSDWLLRKYITEYCPELFVFLKPKTSTNRHCKYVDMFQTISSR